MHDLSASNVTKGLGSDEWHSIRKQLASFKAPVYAIGEFWFGLDLIGVRVYFHPY